MLIGQVSLLSSSPPPRFIFHRTIVLEKIELRLDSRDTLGVILLNQG